jgi:predicted outer membrane repeat protein
MIGISLRMERKITDSARLIIGLSFIWCLICTNFAVTVQAREVFVPDGWPTIQDAIDTVEEGDVITVRDGVYLGWDNTDLDFKGKKITVQSENGPFRTIIDCEGSGRGFYFSSNETAESIVRGFTIRFGSVQRGGGIYCYKASPTIQNCVFTQNTVSSMGGGLYCSFEASPRIQNCLFTDNHAETGAGIFCEYYSNPDIQNCTFTGNTAISSGGGLSAENQSAPKVKNCIFWADSPDEIVAGQEISIEYCDVQGGAEGAGNIDEDPEFTAGLKGVHYLSQIASGQIVDSPCLDTGSNAASSVCMSWTWGLLCMDELTTRTDDLMDQDMVDMGFHYFPESFVTPTPTPYQFPTPPPSATPTATATVTPTPTPAFSTRLTMPDTYFSPGSVCWLRLEFENHMGTLWNVPIFVVLELSEQYWFWPDWSTQTDYGSYSLPEGSSGLKVIEPFYWPDTGAATLQGIRFWGFVTDPDLANVFGGDDGLSVWEFGFGP